MAVALVEPADPDSFHPLHVKFLPETRRAYRHSDHARLYEWKQRTFVARARSDFPRSSASVPLRLESPLEECVSSHNVLSGSRTNVRPLWQLVYADVPSQLLQTFDVLHDLIGSRMVVRGDCPQMRLSTSKKLSVLLPETIKTPTYLVSMSTIVSTVVLACASGHQTATPEMN